ncbi:hypothetical protein CA13_00650 [Planctomycetes bacterium CA13]|uniref:Uncharacterized protein n=1 Tax=Novipirellula herctigrandis TaxID=2527986 RepID=A0A5C5YUG3_9BACT|nr:hypothetical protein CA13_00650 [Planctomycetes bacterium CA13]
MPQLTVSRFQSGNGGDQRGRAKDLQADEKTDHPSSVASHGYPPACGAAACDGDALKKGATTATIAGTMKGVQRYSTLVI